MRKMIGAFAALLLIAVAATGADVRNSKFVKQVGGGSTGDSLTAAADTSSAMLIPKKATSWWVVAAADSQARYYTEISPDGTYWFRIDTDSTGGASQAEATADFGSLYAGMQVRVILDPMPAGSSPYGAAWIFWTD